MLGDISGAANIYIITGYTDMRKSMPYPTTDRRKILKTSSVLKSGVVPWHTGQSTVLKTIFHQ